MKSVIKEILWTFWVLYLLTRPLVSATQSVERGHSWFAGFMGGLSVAIVLGVITFGIKLYLRSKASKTASPPESANAVQSPRRDGRQE